MAGIKISALPAVASALTTDFFPVVQGGVTSRETLAQVLTLYQASATNFTGLTGPLEAPTFIGDLSGNKNLSFTYSASAVNFLVSQNGATGNAPILSATGSDTNVSFFLATKGNGSFRLQSPTGTTMLSLQPNSGSNSFLGSFSLPTITANRTYTLPDISGSVVVTTTARSVLSTDATGAQAWLPLTDGQVVIGSTAGAPAAASLSAGPGISISNGSNSITISGTGSGIGWTEVTAATQAITADNGYVANRATLVTFTLPATAAFGTAISLIGKGAGGWQINQNAGQNIQIGSVSSTVGAGGSIASSNRFDSIELICTTANTTWTALGGVQGAITIV